MDVQSRESPKREEQVLVLAAGGLTDKEIAARLGISPDTVGTYWRRILAKFQAASRTEVVAKYTHDRAQKSLDNLRYVNDCLKLVADHMIQHGVATGGIADAILSSAPDWILLIDDTHNVVFSNRPLAPSAPLSSLFTQEDLESALAIAYSGPVDASWTTQDGVGYEFCLAPGVGSLTGHIVACGRPA